MRDSVPGAAALGKAVSVLDHLASSGPAKLADLVAATGMPRATTHRVACALVSYGLLDKGQDGSYRLGPHLVELGRAAVQQRPGLAQAAAPVLARLRDLTGESVQLFVAEGGKRVCIVSLQSPHGLRTIVELGAVLPMDRGSAGRVLSRGSHLPGEATWAESVEERELGVASVSAGVYLDGAVIAAVSVSGPVERTSRSPGKRYGELVAGAAREVSAALM
ncbi:MAG TPA: IclR family transcriptional regulator [Acidimicrobiales bacterium]|nr:IclR family transcriptional regulator [Acidimicrobiales bacterium]